MSARDRPSTASTSSSGTTTATCTRPVRTDATGTDRPAVHAQTLAAYRLLDELRGPPPRPRDRVVLVSGGARVDLGVLARTDRVWTSDCNDALERVAIQRWTGLLVPPERMGSHVGPPRAHTTHRDLDLSLRMLVALGGHAGLEWDITTCTPDELEALRALVGALPRAAPAAAPRRCRALRPPGRRPSWSAGWWPPTGRMPCSPSSRPSPAAGSPPARCRCPGSTPTAGTGCACAPRPDSRPRCSRRLPAWWDEAVGDGLVVSGAALGRVGLALPVLAPAQGFLLHLETADRLTPGRVTHSRRGHRPRRADPGIPRLPDRAAPGDLHDAAPRRLAARRAGRVHLGRRGARRPGDRQPGQRQGACRPGPVAGRR